jgi:hypothetical protein
MVCDMANQFSEIGLMIIVSFESLISRSVTLWACPGVRFLDVGTWVGEEGDTSSNQQKNNIHMYTYCKNVF